MAGKRTKKQKQKIELRREETLSYSITELKNDTSRTSNQKSSVTIQTGTKKSAIKSGFDTSYVVKDILKTGVVTVVVVAVLVAYTILVK